MSNINLMNANAYCWRNAALSSVATKTTSFAGMTHSVKRTAPAKARATLRAWDGPTT